MQYKNLDKIKEYMSIVLKAFEYYLYNKYNENYIYNYRYRAIGYEIERII